MLIFWEGRIRAVPTPALAAEVRRVWLDHDPGVVVIWRHKIIEGTLQDRGMRFKIDREIVR